MTPEEGTAAGPSQAGGETSLAGFRPEATTAAGKNGGGRTLGSPQNRKGQGGAGRGRCGRLGPGSGRVARSRSPPPRDSEEVG